MYMQNGLTPGTNNLQPQSSSLQPGSAGLQQTGGVTTSDDTTSILSQQPSTDQLRVATQGEPGTRALPAPAPNNIPVGLWFLLAMSFVFIAIGLILRWRSNSVQPPLVALPEAEPTPTTTPLVSIKKTTKPKKKQSRKKRASKR